MLKALDEFSKPRLNWLFYLNLNDPITVSLFWNNNPNFCSIMLLQD